MSDTNSDSEISQRAFLVGCPRSGTTLLQTMLMGHPRVASFPETHFFDRGFGGRKRWVLHETLRGWYLWYLLVRWLMETDDISFSAARRIPISWSKSRMAETFCRILDRRALEKSRDVWLEKTPRHLHVLDVIEEHVPSPKFIHIVRDGRAVIASLHQLAQSNPEKWATYKSVDAAIERWNRSIRDTLEHGSSSSHVVVCYDEFVVAPERTIRTVCRLLDIVYDPRMVESFQKEAEHVVRSHESWKEGAVDAPLEHRGLEKYHDEFSETDRSRIESKLDWERYESLGFKRL